MALFYLWLPDVELSIARVKERVEHGGHAIPEEDIRRRFPRSIKNLQSDYGKLCDITLCFDNSAEPELIYTQRGEQIKIENTLTYKRLLEQADYETR